MKRRLVATLVLAVLTDAGLAAAQPAVPPAPVPPAAAPPAGAAPAPAAPAASGSFTLREAPTGGLVSGKDALRVEPGGLTAAAVAERAVAESPDARVAEARVRAAAAKVDKTVVMFLPRLSVSAKYMRTSPSEINFGGGAMVGALNEGPILVADCPVPGMEGQQCAVDSAGIPLGATPFDIATYNNHYSLSASLAVPISDYVLRLSNALDATKVYESSTRIGLRAARLATAANAKVAYYNWLRAVAAVAVAESSLTRTQALLNDTRTAFTLGAATRADVMRLEALVAGTEQMINESRGFRSVAAEQLATMMAEPSQEYRVGEDVLGAPAPAPSGPSEALVAEAMRQRLEVQAIDAAARAIDRGVRAARVSQYPRLDAFGQFDYARPNSTYFPATDEWKHNWAVGLSLSYTLNDPLDSRASIAEFSAQKAEIEANRLALERGVRLEVTSTLIGAQNARSAVETARRGAEAAGEAYRVSRELYRAGRATTTDLINAEGELVAASLHEVNALLDVKVADVKLEHALGRDVPQK